MTGGARLIGSLLIAFRVPPSLVPARLPRSAAASAVWLSFYDPATGHWQDVASSYDAASGTVTARVSHLSWWMPWTWDWQGIVLRLRQDLSAFGSGRAPAVSCPPVSGVTVSSAGGSDPPVIGCAAKAGTDALTITLTDNRGLSEVLSGVPPDATPGPPAYNSFYQYLATSTAATALLGGKVIPPTATLAYTLPLHGGAVAFTAAPTLFSYAFDLIDTVGSAILGTTKFKGISAGAYAGCALNAVARSRPAAPADLPALAVSCIDVLASLTPDLAALVKVIGTKALLGITLDLQLVLQTGDLFSDEVLRHVEGNVTIIRPACDAASCQPHWSAVGQLALGPITSVSCAGLFCAAVGATGTPGHSHGYALTYQAGTWSKPVPLGTGDSYTVSCPTATYCAAVTDTGFAYRLQAGTWSGATDIYPVANVQPSSTDAVEDLSCATPSFCVAVTAMGDALTWNGTVWSPPESMELPEIQPPLFPGNLGYVGISCPTPVFCLAGTGNSGTGPDITVAATWDGTSWTGTPAGSVSGPGWNVSCVSAAFCMAAAGYHAIGDISSTWNGTSWSGLAHPPGEGAALAFTQVSCPQVGFCLAVDGGAHINGSSAGDRGSAVFAWSNGTWSGPQFIDPSGYFLAVSCTADGLCVAGDSLGGIFMT